MMIDHMFQLFNIDLWKFADLDRSHIILFYPITRFYLFHCARWHGYTLDLVEYTMGKDLKLVKLELMGLY